MSEQILVINAGSSSLKFHMYKVQPGDQLDFEFGGRFRALAVSSLLSRSRMLKVNP